MVPGERNGRKVVVERKGWKAAYLSGLISKGWNEVWKMSLSGRMT